MDDYLVISGQTSLEALKRIKRDLLEQRRDVPKVVEEVSARIMRYDTPLAIRQFAAGDAQAAQTQVDVLDLADVARLFLAGDAPMSFLVWVDVGGRLSLCVVRVGMQR